MSFSVQHDVRVHRQGIDRRCFLRQTSAAGLASFGALSFRDALNARAEEIQQAGYSVILLWMQGGPSQFETFDPKPDTANGGPTKAISTAVSGIQIAQGWNKVAGVMNDISLIRSMTNKEGQHARATYQMHTGYVPTGTVKHPSFGCAIAKEIAPEDLAFPSVVAVGRTVGAGFLGVDYEPFVVPRPGEMPGNVTVPVPANRLNRRLGLLDRLEGEFAGRGGENVVSSHKKLYDKTAKMVLSPKVSAFDIEQESQSLRDQYGNSNFGKGCLLARRLVEAGSTFVEVAANGWDTHQDNFTRTGNNAAQVDPGFGTLIADLKDRGMLDRTLVLWMGEFGRTPKINPRTGRDHYPRCFNAAIAGAGIKGGQVIGSSTDDGTTVKDHPVSVLDLFSTICQTVKVNPAKENISPLGRPMKIVDGGTAIPELIG
ncbi:MAG: DUF1501 domain-containing protein [Planctomycetota bacterium]|nr:DUF1501 domain-containing protein [Planctomycetota bacterium]